MRIGLIADIHANLPALQAVIGAMDKVDRLLCAGDLVGYYAEPNEVCDCIRRMDVTCVRGNHDAYVTGALIPNDERRPIYRTDWTRNVLTAANLRWLNSLSIEHRLSINGTTIILRHASPWDEETYLYPDSERIKEIQLSPDEVLVVGHSHYPMIKQSGEGLVINPGSVGQPRDYTPGAAFAILDLTTKAVVHYRVAYDIAAYQERLSKLGWDEKTRSILSRRRRS